MISFSFSRSTRLEVFCKYGILKNFAIFVGKHLCWNISLINLQVKLLQHRYFFCEFCNILKNTCFVEHLQITASGDTRRTTSQKISPRQSSLRQFSPFQTLPWCFSHVEFSQQKFPSGRFTHI